MRLEINYVEYFPVKLGGLIETTHYVCGCIRDEFADQRNSVYYYPCQQHYRKA